MKRALFLLGVAACGDRTARPAASADVAVDTRGDAIAIFRPYVVPSAGLAPGVAYLDIRNGSVADTLRGIRIGGAEAMLHDASMQMLGEVAIPASQTVRLAPGGLHAMYTLAGRTLARGDTVTVELAFARRGRMPVLARVIDYADVDTATAPRPEE